MQSTPRRGRPPEADRDQVSAVALRLFERKGVERVTMDEIAEAASVSRRTLFRLFPSKADLVWDGLNEVLGAVKLRAASLARTKSSLKVLVEELLALTLRLLEDPVAAKLVRRRLRLIAASPALFNHKALEELQQVIATAVATHAPKTKEPASLVARSLVAVAFGAMLWWAEHEGTMTALEAIRAAFHALAQVGDLRVSNEPS